jgi:dTDP-4-dehydrorhamnose reductase
VKVLVTGATGMLGFAIHRVLHDRGYHVLGTVRGDAAPASPWCAGLRYAFGVEATRFASVEDVIERFRPDAVVNAAGIIKQITEAGDSQRLMLVNSVFPRLLAMAAEREGFRVVHFSTDCVFAGSAGNYAEDALPDATDLYGMSKFAGEPASPRVLVLRTSIIGRGLAQNNSLLDWFLRQRGEVQGYSRAIFSGLPVSEQGRVLAERILPRLHEIAGLLHLAGAPISKLELLRLAQAQWNKHDVTLVPNDSVAIDRSLDSARLRARIGYAPPAWPALLSDLHAFYAALPTEVVSR